MLKKVRIQTVVYFKKHFNQIKKVSDEMNKQTNQFEDYVTNVEVH